MADEPFAQIEIPTPVAALGERVAGAGGELYIVGGWVRDHLRGVDCRDIDLATSLSPAQLKKLLTGLGSVYDIGEKFGTVGLLVGDYTIETTTYRLDEYTPGSRHPRVTPVPGIDDDLARRDFTINAIALSVAPETGRVLDPFGGREAVERGIIRTPGPPAPRMAEDPLRMLRAVRFAAQLGYAIETGLLEVLEKDAGLLDSISWERRREELEKTIVSPHPDAGVRTLVDTGLMEYVAPEVSAMKGVEQPPAYHRADVLEHTLLMMMELPPDALLRRAALFHDLGKPGAKVTEPKTMFPEHDKISEAITRRVMKRLRYSNDDIGKTAFLVRRHMRPIRYRGDWSDSAVRRFIRDCVLLKEDEVTVPLEAVMELARADILAGSVETTGPNLALLDELKERAGAVRVKQHVETIRSPLDGGELQELFDRPGGPWIRELKDHLVQLVVDGKLGEDDREEAVRVAREFMAGRQG